MVYIQDTPIVLEKPRSQSKAKMLSPLVIWRDRKQCENLGWSDIKKLSGKALEDAIDEAKSGLGDCRKRRRVEC